MAGAFAATAFLPVAGAELIDDGAVAVGPGLRIYAAAGTAVHAVVAGTVEEAPQGGTLALRGDDALLYRFARLAELRTLVRRGERVAAGQVIGAVDAARGDRSHLELSVLSGTSDLLDPYTLLVGLADPGELGVGGDDPLVGLDPDRGTEPVPEPEVVQARRPTPSPSPAAVAVAVADSAVPADEATVVEAAAATAEPEPVPVGAPTEPEPVVAEPEPEREPVAAEPAPSVEPAAEPAPDPALLRAFLAFGAPDDDAPEGAP